MNRLAVGVALVNAIHHGVGQPAAAFEEHGYRAPTTDHDWSETVGLARRLHGLLGLVAEQDHQTAIHEVNTWLRHARVTPQIEQTGGQRQLHFHTPAADFADGWTAGIAAALAIAYSVDDTDRIGRRHAPECSDLFLDRGRNKQRRFCSLRCQNRVKSASYRAKTSSTPSKPAEHSKRS